MNRVGIKVQPSEMKTADMLSICLLGATGNIGYIDGAMVNEITADEYNNLTVAQLFAKYPYVNGIQPMMGLDVQACGENLVRNGNGEEGINCWRNPYGSIFVTADEGFLITSKTSESEYVYQEIRVKPNTNYMLGFVGTHDINVKGYDGYDDGAAWQNTTLRTNTGGFNSGNYDTVQITLIGGVVGSTKSVREVSLTEGTTAPAAYKSWKG
jgi:hypothetical protein